MNCTKIALGTAQFGLNYGIANTTGQVTVDQGTAILELASAHGIDTIKLISANSG